MPLANFYALFTKLKTINWNFSLETHPLLSRTENTNQTAISKATKDHLQNIKRKHGFKNKNKKRRKRKKKKKQKTGEEISLSILYMHNLFIKPKN